MQNNPFSIISPEELDAEHANQLFVELHSSFPEITREGNTFIEGARGCGKSMMIRCSLPDVLMIRNKQQFDELQYLAFCMPVKKTSLNLQELEQLTDCHAPFMLNEHFLVVHVLMHIFLQLTKVNIRPDTFRKEQYRDFITHTFERKLRRAGYQGDLDINFENWHEFFMSLYLLMDSMVDDFVSYLVRLIQLAQVDYSYEQPILSFARFLVPVLRELVKLPAFPNNRPIFIFIDDADGLSKIQTRIINSWLASRTQPLISLKISSQIGLYKTFCTSNGVMVEAPHDYQKVDISYLKTTSSSSFYKKATDILAKRLQIAGINIDAQQFFPPDKKQEEKIHEEEEKIRNTYEENGRGFCVGDDVRRYAIPNYIKSLGGTKKSRHTYKYAGLDNIIHLSSGIIRYLLDATATMYDISVSEEKKSGMLKSISPSVQNDVSRDKADVYLFSEFRKNSSEQDEDDYIAVMENPNNTVDKLGNLINAMGKTFHEILISERAERKVFSVALSNIPDEEIRQVFDLGVRLGFFHISYIGNKAGNGRTYLYVLNRCFAPAFTLDPTGFQGYLFMTNEDLKKAMYNGKQLRTISEENDVYQLSLADFWEE